MSFLKNSTTFTRYRVIDEVPKTLWAELPDKLRQFSFKDIDELPEERAWGWVCFEDMLDSDWSQFPPQKGGDYFTFSLRLDTRRVPPAVIKKHFGLALKVEEAKMRELGKTYVARERKKEIKEQVMLKLKMRFLPIPAEFQVIWNTTSSHIFIATASGKVLELFEEFFLHSFGLHLEQLTPYGIAAEILGDAGLEKLDTVEPTSFRM